MKYQKGDLVRIINHHNGHRFTIGEIVTIVDVKSDDYCARSKDDYWWIKDDEIEAYDESNSMNAEQKLQAIQSLLDGVYDDPQLLKIGELFIDDIENIKTILAF